jgi:D-glycero-D-manno-heptose 1,7-bisphosphate phosphatase
MRRFAVLDRDGTIVVDRGHLSDPAGLELEPGAAVGLRRLAALGLGLAVVTNQSAVGRGLLDAAGLATIHRALEKLLAGEGVRLDGIYACPHLPDDGCACRKPRTALLEQAARDLGFNASEAFVIGDKASDIELGRKVGATTILVDTGYGKETAEDPAADPDYRAADLAAAADLIASLLERSAASSASAAQGGNQP